MKRGHRGPRIETLSLLLFALIPATATKAETTAQPSAATTVADITSPTSAAATRFRDAHLAAERGDDETARKGFEESIGALPLLADHALFYSAKLAAEQGDNAAANQHLERLLEKHAASVFAVDALVLRGDLAVEADDARSALKYYDAALGAASGSSQIPARVGRARALAANGRKKEAWLVSLELATVSGREGKAAQELREDLARSDPAELGVSPVDFALGLGRARVQSGQARAAINILEPLLGSENDPDTRAQAELLVAAAHRTLGAEEVVRQLWAGLITRGTPTKLAGDALYARARAAWNRDDDIAARKDYQSLLLRFPDHARVADARHALARIAESAGELDRAATLYGKLAALHPASRAAETATWRRGFAEFLAGRYAAAAEVWRSLGEEEAGMYWRARSLAMMGQPAVAGALGGRLRTAYPMSYYAWWLDGPEPRASAPRPSAPSELPTDPDALLHLRRARLLGDLELSDSAERELDATRRLTGPSRLLLAEYTNLGAWSSSIRIARGLERRGESGLERAVHPLAHADAFRRAGARHGVDPLLLAALARRESLFDRRARSPVGAYGLMQLMPETARATAGKTTSTEELANGATNIDLGTRYLAKLLKKYDGRLIPALAAYNAGPDPVARWEEANGARPGDEFVELITYRETRRYVKAVLENYRIYRSLYGGGATNPVLY